MFNYLKHTSLCYYDGFHTWSICPVSGSLLKQKAIKKRNKIPTKVAEILNFCDNPYLCTPSEFSQTELLSSPNDMFRQTLLNMYSRLSSINNNKFLLFRLYASFTNQIFDKTYSSIDYFNLIFSHGNKLNELCLIRTILAAKTSKSFKNNGVIFIGAALPSSEMHAWIIEDGTQPDRLDRDWINFRPLLALHFF